jgi:hypothetical protein
MAKMGMESTWAVYKPVTKLLAPGPEVAAQTPTAPRSGVAIRHMDGAFFVSRDHVFNGSEILKGVVKRKDTGTGDPKNVFDPLTFKNFNRSLH